MSFFCVADTKSFCGAVDVEFKRLAQESELSLPITQPLRTILRRLVMNVGNGLKQTTLPRMAETNTAMQACLADMPQETGSYDFAAICKDLR